jgi:hypothetical protein
VGNREGQSPVGLVIDRGARLGPFAGARVGSAGERIEFIPRLVVAGQDGPDLDTLVGGGEEFGFIVVVACGDGLPGPDGEALRRLVGEQAPRIITCVDRRALDLLRLSGAGVLRELLPDIVVFDESFVDRQVPFAAFTAPKALYDHWTTRGRSTFHSTTFQPNAISTVHFLRCLRQADPEFWSSVAGPMERIARDPAYRARLLAALYSPALARAIDALALGSPGLRASGYYITAGGRRIFDGVAGIACSVRGHNPRRLTSRMSKIWKNSPTAPRPWQTVSRS